MLIWIFMILDLLVLAVITIAQFTSLEPFYLMFLSISYLTIKGLMFLGEIMSSIDLLVAFYIFLMFLNMEITGVYFTIMAWFLYKLVFVLFADAY